MPKTQEEIDAEGETELAELERQMAEFPTFEEIIEQMERIGEEGRERRKRLGLPPADT